MMQVLGPALMLAAFIGAELCERLLSAAPGSAWFWYMTLEVFRPFELARVHASPVQGLFGPNALPLACACATAALAAHRLRLRFVVAVLAHVALLVSAALAMACLTDTSGIGRLSDRLAGGGAWLVMLLVAGSLASCLAVHRSFLARIRAELEPSAPGVR